MSLDKGFFFRKVHGTRVIPVSLKITIMFVIFILVSNFASNYVNLMTGRSIQFKLMKELLAKDLKDIYNFSNTQYEIYQYNRDKQGTLSNISGKAKYDLKNDKALLLCFSPDGEVLTYASLGQHKNVKIGKETLNKINQNVAKGKKEDFVIGEIGGEEYFGIYKYNEKWNMYLLRAEEMNEFYKESRQNFIFISFFIIGMTILSTIAGVFALRYILRFIGIITNSIMEMVKSTQLQLINLKKAPNDDITYMGIAFNSLSSSIDTLLTIFRKFANKDVVIKAYRDKEILLEGNKRELTILFSDIKGFTFITETLGTDIIKLINMHYDQSIREIVNHDGVIGSIIGDALLAVFGTMDEVSEYNKSYAAVLSAYKLHDVAQSLRDQMSRKRNELLKKKKKLSDEEERVYQAVLLQIGVGIDGGEVFYGNIGSYVRMTNTVIGDNVNSSSRLEGLTRFYKIPVICSEYVKNDIEKNVPKHNISFFEIDQVQVKGKTEGKKIYWPVKNEDMTPKLKKNLLLFSAALMEYYDGNWRKAHSLFAKCDLPPAEVFSDRTRQTCPRNWKGVWAMTTK
ncbi:MAG TPA: adenylate/guanylate cyclase domain-containing protein [Spirochaetota bacterium]|nr:adenylate/guanylate cyclase domain-containing protein [Spirochaetota bacterium]